MSYYTNDTDTLRQMLSQSIPQVLSSVVTIAAVFCAMLYLSVYMTIFVILFVMIMMFVVKFVGGNSAKYFIKQQKSIVMALAGAERIFRLIDEEEEQDEGYGIRTGKNYRTRYS